MVFLYLGIGGVGGAPSHVLEETDETHVLEETDYTHVLEETDDTDVEEIKVQAHSMVSHGCSHQTEHQIPK